MIILSRLEILILIVIIEHFIIFLVLLKVLVNHPLLFKKIARPLVLQIDFKSLVLDFSEDFEADVLCVEQNLALRPSQRRLIGIQLFNGLQIFPAIKNVHLHRHDFCFCFFDKLRQIVSQFFAGLGLQVLLGYVQQMLRRVIDVPEFMSRYMAEDLLKLHLEQLIKHSVILMPVRLPLQLCLQLFADQVQLFLRPYQYILMLHLHLHFLPILLKFAQS